jgi:NTE family protein
LDDPVVARKGIRTSFDFEYNSNLESGIAAYPVARARAEYYRPATGSGSWFLAADGGTVFGADDVYFPPFLLGGPRTFGAYGQNEIRATQMLYGTAGWTQELYRLPAIVGDRVFALAFYQVGTTKEFGKSRTPHSATVAVTFKTSLGPLFVGGSLGNASHRRWYFGMGRVF